MHESINDGMKWVLPVLLSFFGKTVVICCLRTDGGFFLLPNIGMREKSSGCLHAYVYAHCDLFEKVVKPDEKVIALETRCAYNEGAIEITKK